MTEREIDRVLRRKWPSCQPIPVRKSKLKMRYGKSDEALAKEILRTELKLSLLLELKAERDALHRG